MSLHAEVRSPDAPVVHGQGWAMTERAHRSLAAAVVELAADVARHHAEGTAERDVERDAPPAVANLTGRRLLGELRNARAALSGAWVEVNPHVAVVGSAVTIEEPGGSRTTYTLVIPGDGDPALARISVDSPVGQALYRRRPGDVIDVTAPAGSWQATVIRVD